MADRKVAFDALPHDNWPDIAAALALPWPRAAAAHDLRWHAVEHHVGRRALPDVRSLAVRWGWSRSSVERMIKATAKWADEARPWGWRTANPAPSKDQAKEQGGTKVGQERDKGGTRAGQTERTNADDAWIMGHDRDTTGTEVGQEWDSRARRDHPAPGTQHPAPSQDGEIISSSSPTPVTPPAPAEGAPAPPGRTEPDDLRLYRLLQQAQPRRSATPTADARKAMRRILAEAGSLARAELYLAWCHESDDERARQLRGEAPWPDGALTRRMDPESLSRHVGARLDLADAWQARGRTVLAEVVIDDPPRGRPRPPSRADDRREAVAHLARAQARLAEITNPPQEPTWQPPLLSSTR